MPTDAALLAQLQSLWQAAPPPPTLPAVSTDRPPKHPVGEQGEEANPLAAILETFLDAAPHVGRKPGCDDVGVTDRPLSAGDAYPAEGVCLWPDEPTAAGLGTFAMLDDAEREYLLGRHCYPEPCGFCGGRYRHNPQCVALCDEWQIPMPFGKHKGKPVASLNHDYLAWLLTSGRELTAELRREIERIFEMSNSLDTSADYGTISPP